MNDDVREAAELCRKYSPGTGIDSQSELVTFAHARELIVAEYLTEHLVDDDKPVTEEWLRSAGFAEDENTNILLGPMEYFLFSGGPELLIDHSSGEYRLKSRGDVRRLCRALRIKEDDPRIKKITEVDS